MTRSISRAIGDALVATGAAVQVFDTQENRYDYQLLEEKPVANGTPAVPTPASLTANDARLISGMHGASKTRGLAEELRLLRCDPLTRRPLPAEDPVERAEEKLKLWPHPAPGRGDRAVRVYPKANQRGHECGASSR